MTTLSKSSFEMEISDTACSPNQSVFAPPTVVDLGLSKETPREGWNETKPCDGVAPDLVGISETMLWSLHNRASEAKRPDGVLVDPDSVRIQSAIEYDFARHFGDPVGSLAARAAEIDRVLRLWLRAHPDGCVVALGEGLETQVRRVDNGRLRWLSVDLPEAIRLRERFLAPNDRFFHIAANALDPAWMDAADSLGDMFIVAQGLLMYLEPESVRQLFTTIADRFPTAEIVFDTVPRWFSDRTRWGLNLTPHYRLPAMPWGINRDELELTLRSWHRGVADVEFLDYRAPRGLPRLLADMTSQIPVARHAMPSLVHVTMGNAAPLHAVNFNTATETTLASNGEQNGTSHMTAKNDNTPHEDTTDGIVAMAMQNASRGNDITAATMTIIAKRLALGLAAAADPLHADHVEFARVVPEKLQTFSAVGMVMLSESGKASRQMLKFASEEVVTTACATLAMTGCFGPAALGRGAKPVCARVAQSADLELQYAGNAVPNRAGRRNGAYSPDGRGQR